MLKSAVIQEKKFKHSPRVVADNTFGPKFWYQQEGLITMVICRKFKKNLFILWLYTYFFHDLINVYSWRSGADNPRGQNFDVNRNILSLRSFVASFIKISLKSDFIQKFFMILYMYIAPGQGQAAPRGQNFDVNRNVFTLHPFVTSLKTCLWSLILYNFLHDLIHVYSPGAGTESPQGTKFWCQQEGFITLPISCKFQRNLYEVFFYTIFFFFFSWFNTCI